jgi:hypothetical protein
MTLLIAHIAIDKIAQIAVSDPNDSEEVVRNEHFGIDPTPDGAHADGKYVGHALHRVERVFERAARARGRTAPPGALDEYHQIDGRDSSGSPELVRLQLLLGDPTADRTVGYEEQFRD